MPPVETPKLQYRIAHRIAIFSNALEKKKLKHKTIKLHAINFNLCNICAPEAKLSISQSILWLGSSVVTESPLWNVSYKQALFMGMHTMASFDVEFFGMEVTLFQLSYSWVVVMRSWRRYTLFLPQNELFSILKLQTKYKTSNLVKSNLII